MLSIVGWTELFEISFPRAKSDQRLRCGHRAAKWWGRSGSGGEERRKSLRRRLRWRRIWMGKFHLLVWGLSWAIMAENKEKSCNNRLLHQIQTSLVWKMKRWNDRGHPQPFCFFFILLFLLLTCPFALWFHDAGLMFDQQLHDCADFLWAQGLRSWEGITKCWKIWFNWASMFIPVFIHSTAFTFSQTSFNGHMKVRHGNRKKGEKRRIQRK